MKLSDFKLLIQSYRAMSKCYTNIITSIDGLSGLVGINLYWEGVLSHPYRISSYTNYKRMIHNKAKHFTALSELVEHEERVMYI